MMVLPGTTMFRVALANDVGDRVKMECRHTIR